MPDGFEWRGIFVVLVQVLDVVVLSILVFYCLHHIIQLVAAWLELLEVRRESASITPWWLLTEW